MPSHPTHTFRAARVFALVAALFLTAAVALMATPAYAHDELSGSDPASGSTVDVLPAQLTLTFSGDLLGDAGATEVQVTDAGGTSIAAGAPVVQGNVVSQPLAPGATGTITVLWRVVSSDGHPISDQFGFTVTAPATPTPTPSTSATTAPTASPSPSPVAPSPTSSVSPAPADGGSSALPWVLFGVVAAAVLGGVVYLLVSRSRRAAELERARVAGVSTTPGSTPPGPSSPGSDGPSER
ncbi:copper resistance CopC family protein [Microbacterium rhizomatis]|uniref:copper resistance CopC family protein n=1 Tax=Microbacterium rhizomatis TaxID=1631477 RepID=UPI001FEC900A|nr:copper resistance CopC family protein [Microbacterium rhizomatis]